MRHTATAHLQPLVACRQAPADTSKAGDDQADDDEFDQPVPAKAKAARTTDGDQADDNNAADRPAAGVTLNLMSFGGLAVAIGLVVDDAIVVTEGIVRRLEDGHPASEAVELGTRDMFAVVIGTTFATVVVFAPLALLTGG